MTLRPTRSPLFPYTTLFRSATEGSAPMDGGMPGRQPGLRDSDGVRLSVFRNHVPRLRSEEHTSELQSLRHLVCRLLLEKKNEKQPKSQRLPSAGAPT